MIRILLCIGLVFSLIPAKAQLANGAPAPDFTVTDVNGVAYSLYAKMGSNKGACVDFSATWCGVCWQFHEDGILKSIYNNLAADATAVFLEADHSTNTNCLYGMTGCNVSTHGDWVTGEPYQIADLSPSNGPNVKNDYDVTYYPVVYVISPDKRAWEVRTLVYQEFVNWLTKSFKLAAMSTLTHCTCGANGKITLNASGGYGALAYLWSNGSGSKDLIDIPAGNYSVTITDQNGYFKSFGPWTINNPPKRVDITNVQLTHVKCYNESTGRIELQVGFGTPPYSYNWSNNTTNKNADNLKAGNYTVTVSDQVGCTQSKSYTIVQPTALVLTATATKESCDEMDGSINGKALGGVPPYYYDIGSGPQQIPLFSNLKGGKDYNLSLTDENGCSETIKVTVDVTHRPQADAGIVKSFVDCIKAYLMLDGGKSSQGPSFSYLWTTIDGNILRDKETLYPVIELPGKYELKVTDTNNKCVDIEAIQVTDQRVFPNIKTEGDTTLDCKLSEITLKGSSDTLPVNFYWKKADDSLFHQDGKILITSDSGRFIFFVKDTINLCTAHDTVFVQKDQTLPVAIASASKDVSCKVPEIEIDGSASSQGPTILYQWTTKTGNILSGANTLMPIVNKGGDYFLLVQNIGNQCEQTTTVIIREQIKPTADFSQNINNLIIHLEDQSLGVPTSWKWNFGDGVTSAQKNPSHAYAVEGEYTICLEIENDCNLAIKCKKVLVGIQATLELASWIAKDVSCFEGQDGSIVLSVQGGIPPYTFAWSNQKTTKDIHDLPAGDYSVIITDQQSTKITKSISIDQPSEIIINNFEIIHDQAGQQVGSILLNLEGGILPYAYLWSNGLTTNPIQSLTSGKYFCIVTDGNGCTKEFGPYIVKELTFVDDAEKNLKNANEIILFNVLPNPVNNFGFINLKFVTNQKYRLDIVTMFGKSIWNMTYNNSGIQLPIAVNNFPPGVYFVTLRTERFQKILKWVIE